MIAPCAFLSKLFCLDSSLSYSASAVLFGYSSTSRFEVFEGATPDQLLPTEALSNYPSCPDLTELPLFPCLFPCLFHSPSSTMTSAFANTFAPFSQSTSRVPAVSAEAWKTVVAPSAPFLDPEGDVVLRSSDGQRFHVVRAILSIASPVYRDMFGQTVWSSTTARREQRQIGQTHHRRHRDELHSQHPAAILLSSQEPPNHRHQGRGARLGRRAEVRYGGCRSTDVRALDFQGDMWEGVSGSARVLHRLQVPSAARGKTGSAGELEMSYRRRHGGGDGIHNGRLLCAPFEIQNCGGEYNASTE